MIELLIERRDDIRDWLEDVAAGATIDQCHLVEYSPERAYWHHGYQAALDDVIRQIIAADSAGCNVGKPN
jgi:hypothetical protein